MDDISVLVVYEACPSSRRALAAAAALGAPLTVATLAPREPRTARCVVHTADLEQAVRDAAERDLAQARAALGAHAAATHFVVLTPRRDDDVAVWAAGAGCTTALLGARRAILGLRPRNLLARSLARAGLDVRIVA
jgi:hypothetical protein